MHCGIFVRLGVSFRFNKFAYCLLLLLFLLIAALLFVVVLFFVGVAVFVCVLASLLLLLRRSRSESFISRRVNVQSGMKENTEQEIKHEDDATF